MVLDADYSHFYLINKMYSLTMMKGKDFKQYTVNQTYCALLHFVEVPDISCFMFSYEHSQC